MISRLLGKLIHKRPPEMLIDVNGVGYEVLASMYTFDHLPEVGESVCLWTHLVVREDAHMLYAFHDDHERGLFRALIKVNGVGPKSALSILSSIAPEDFVAAVTQQDTARLKKVPGIGPKTAERLVIEMRDKLSDTLANSPYASASPMAVEVRGDRLAQQEAISALVSLGYKPQEASRVLGQLSDLEKLSSAEIIRAALKLLMR